MSAKTSAKPSQKVTFFLAAMWDIYLPRPLPLASDAARLCGFKKKAATAKPGRLPTTRLPKTGSTDTDW